MGYICKTNSRWYHNLEGKIIKVKLEDSVPEGFMPGKGPTGRPAWNKGLTKETDDRVANISKNMEGKNVGNIPWNKGLTKETNKLLASNSEKISKTRLEIGYPCPNKGKKRSAETNAKQSQGMMGKPAWNKGLTKETDIRVAEKAKRQIGKSLNISDKVREEKNRKIYETMKKNNSFNKSQEEENLYFQLCEKYGEEDIIRQYDKDSRYPFRCDFYIISEKLFIEYQGAQEHGDHPFDPTNEEDLKLVEKWRLKAIDKGPKSRYWNYIYWWTEKDPLKLKSLRDNKLNFMLIYPNNLIITE